MPFLRFADNISEEYEEIMSLFGFTGIYTAPGTLKTSGKK